jgi:hypothetical protein
MKEDLLDLWQAPCDARCITTNGSVKPNGRAVMGRGCAKQACARYAFLQLTLGKRIIADGNHVQILIPAHTSGTDGIPLVSFPVKHDWNMRADLVLIRQSAYELVVLADKAGWRSVVLPRPGCGNGQRKWHEVRPILQEILDERFTVVTL